MDTSQDICNDCTLVRREDNYGNTTIETSFRVIIRKCVNSIEEETLPQINGRKMGQNRGHMIVNLTPKCHPDLSGEIIYYSWGCSNNHYIQLSLDKKKDKKHFKKVFKM